MKNTWKHILAGILEIISGAVGLIIVFGIGIAIIINDVYSTPEQKLHLNLPHTFSPMSPYH